ncbi:hypothetical protein BOTBODRAFT_445173 [Botryobasidium botryosum FD-172 SS1]|uniref:Uncharacterized protein n=1 Tax=Botryobasidium botryosum (strain FD-172 SS1) TaxID=930990 RepID=A0A067MV88_BOTB1|nr:hypothetical protein BOTBODRAFT_445173 [Botryobasidium botryosum FD-172 SS1]
MGIPFRRIQGGVRAPIFRLRTLCITGRASPKRRFSFLQLGIWRCLTARAADSRWRMALDLEATSNIGIHEFKARVKEGVDYSGMKILACRSYIEERMPR